MKRISHDSSASLNETAFESLKPVYGSKGNPPYYDPNDLHVHVWKQGKLGLEDNPKIATYAKGKLNIRNCMYCKICHTIKDSFQSSVGSNRDVVTDIIRVFENNTQTIGYRLMDPAEAVNEYIITPALLQNIAVVEGINQSLFHKQEGIFNNYVKVMEVKDK